MSLSPFEHFLQTKQAVDALVPGQVGAGPNPGTTGSMDSDPMQASNTDISMMRMQQGAAPIISRPDADGGAGYSHPAPGTSPSLQMFADVKAASIKKEAQEFAESVYWQAKQANFMERGANAVKGVVAKATGRSAQMTAAPAGAGQVPGLSVADHARHLAGQAQAHTTAGAQAAQVGIADVRQQASEAMAKARQYVDQGTQNAVQRGAMAAHNEPYAAIGIGAAAAAAAGGGGALADHVMMARQAEASKQASQQPNVSEATAYGQAYARSLMGLA
jgi:ElaB/YqjD/DUF883 family membrane-anchored ribosome-binding protein